MLFVSEGNDRRGGQGWRRRSEPAGVSAHYEENLPVLKEACDIRDGDAESRGSGVAFCVMLLTHFSKQLLLLCSATKFYL